MTKNVKKPDSYTYTLTLFFTTHSPTLVVHTRDRPFVNGAGFKLRSRTMLTLKDVVANVVLPCGASLRIVTVLSLSLSYLDRAGQDRVGQFRTTKAVSPPPLPA